MIGSAEILSAIRELTNSKQIDRTELHGLLQDGIHAALAKKHGPTVQAEVEIDERNGKINIVLLKTVVDEVTDPGREISVEEARFEARRTLDALRPYIVRGMPVIGLEPSCLLSFRDEYGVLLKDAAILRDSAFLLEEFLARDPGTLRFNETRQEVLLHGHCHQKAFDAMPAVEKVLRMVPGLKLTTVQTSCCGMAGSFGYEAEHYDVSVRMAELALFPAIRSAPAARLVAGGTSCRHQIADGTGREALHFARFLDAALNAPRAAS